METADASAYYIGADTPERGNTVRGNYFHTLGLGDINACLIWTTQSSGSFVIGNVIRGSRLRCEDRRRQRTMFP